MRVSQIRPLRYGADAVDAIELGAELDAMAADHVAAFADLPGVAEVRKDRFAELHYYAQTHEIEVPMVQRGATLNADDWQATLERFHETHNELYAFDLRGKRPIEVLSVGQELVGVRLWAVPEQAEASSTAE